MDIKSIVKSLTSLIPFWASNIIAYCGIGNEYSMLLNIVLQQIIEPLEEYIDEQIIYYLVGIIIIIVLLYKNNIIDYSLIKSRQTYSIIGSEKDNIIDYSDTMCALTTCFIEEYKMTNILCNHSTQVKMLDVIENYKLKNDLLLSIVRSDVQVKYVLKSYHHDIKKFVDEARNKYDKTINHKYIHFLGKETEHTYNYSPTLISITYTLVKKYGLKRLLSKNNNDVTTVENSENGFKRIDRSEKIISNKRDKSVYLLDEYLYYELEDDLFFSVNRKGENVRYSFYTIEKDLSKFVEECETFYYIDININKYKNRMIIQGNEISSDRSKGRNIYPKEILAINHYLIHEKNYKNFRIIDNISGKLNGYGDYYEDEDNNLTKYALEDVVSLQFDDIILTIDRFRLSENSISITIDYIFESNTVILEDYINDITKKYNILSDERNKDKLYHFILTGFDESDNPLFNKELIYDQKPLLHESFDNIFSVHNEMLKKDMKKLKDIAYYERTGLKRKKSYLFYGEPGCGKTTTAIALSLEDKRHIIDIPMSLVKTCSNFDAVCNLSEIDNITFTKSEVTVLFDEVDLGLDQVLDVNEKEDTQTVVILDDKSNKTTWDKTRGKTKGNQLNLASLLSKFDGICNYSGTVYIALTYRKEKLDTAMCREMRLTPLYFTYCIKEHIIGIINKFYDDEIIIDFEIQITPAKLTFLCEKYEDESVTTLMSILRDISIEQHTNPQ